VTPPRAKILVIEDNPDNMALIQYLLQASGYAPLAAANGREGLEVAVRERPDLILLDIRMPEMDGFEAVAELRKLRELADAPFVAVTASLMRDERERIVAAGFTGYLPKPIDPETFSQAVEEFLPLELRAG
jgi:CheY-like chemotaxis protein